MSTEDWLMAAHIGENLGLPMDSCFLYCGAICRMGVGMHWFPGDLHEVLDVLVAAKALTDPKWKLPNRYLP